jgi:SNF2 family DNA or RNA helicase
MFRLYGMLLSSIKWDCVIVDEAHRLKNEKSKLYQACSKISTKRRFGLTGTIMQNKYIELFNVFEWAAPGSLGPREFFREYYDEPIKQGQRISAPDRFVKIAAERKEHLVSDPELQYNDGVTLEGEFSPNHDCEMFISFVRCGKAASWCMWS